MPDSGGMNSDHDARYVNLAGDTMIGNLAMGDNSITGIDALTFTDVDGTIAGIANKNLVDRTVAETIPGSWTFGNSLTVDALDVVDSLDCTGAYVGFTNIAIDGYFVGDLIPGSDDAYDIGTATRTIHELFIADEGAISNTTESISVENMVDAYDHSQIAGGNSVHVSTAENTNWDAAYTHSQIAGGNSVHVSTTENTNWDAAFTHISADGTSHSGVNGVVTIHSDVSDAGSGIIISDAERTNLGTAYDHSQDNTQAHTDYLLNTGDTATGNYNFDSNTLVIDSTNNMVGIGTASPTYRVDINGDLSFALTGTVTVSQTSTAVIGTGTAFLSELGVGSAIKIKNEIFTVVTLTSDVLLLLDSTYSGANEGGLTAYTDNNLFRVQTGDGGTRLVVDSGNVGIGTSAPANTLTVDGVADFTGNVGIGTTSPNASLEIDGDDVSSDNSIRLGTRNDRYWDMTITKYLNANNFYNLQFQRYETIPAFFIAGKTGYVGIGTVTPSELLDVNGTMELNGYLDLGNSVTSYPSVSNALLYSSAGSAAYPFDDYGKLVLQSRSSGAIRDIVFVTGTTPTVKMVIDGATGNVGIGTIDPNAQLDNLGTTRLGDSTTNYLDVDATGVQTPVGAGGFQFGSCYGTGIAWTLVNPTEDQWYEISDADVATGELGGGVTHDGSGQLTVSKAGRYLINYCVCYESSSAAGKHVEVAISINGTENAAGQGHDESKAVGAEANISSSAVIDVPASATIELSLRTTDAGVVTFTIHSINLTIAQLGGTT